MKVVLTVFVSIMLRVSAKIEAVIMYLLKYRLQEKKVCLQILSFVHFNWCQMMNFI